jgi:hypothetical protein
MTLADIVLLGDFDIVAQMFYFAENVWGETWLFQGQKIFNANFLLSFAKIRPICAFRIKGL